jgi:hypothetical protein
MYDCIGERWRVSPVTERMNLRSLCRLFCAWVALLVGLGLASGQEEAPRFSGYTRPGWPNDKREGGTIKLVANDPNERATAIGGTVYFVVLERRGAAGDSWGSGLDKFDAAFRPGIDFNGASSPALDAGARYLYLYQVVNDRETDSSIQNVSIKLTAALEEVTSWGHFHGVGFGVPKAEGKADKIRPVSFNNVLGPAKDDRLYQSPAEAVTAPQALHLIRVPTKRGEEAPKDDDGKRIVTVVWDALDPAVDPSNTMLLAQSDFNKGPCFRAIWTGDNALKKDGRSTVFGFTSNLAPSFQALRIRGPGQDGKGGPVKPAGNPFGDEPQGAVALSDGPPDSGSPKVSGAEGKAPSPKPKVDVAEKPPPGPGAQPPAEGAAPPPSPGIGPLGSGFAGGPLGGGGGAPGFGAGRIGSAAAVSNGGGGSNSGGGQNQSGTQNNGNNNGTGTNAGHQTQSLVFNPILINQQQQSQFQQQRQRQQQHQHQHQHQHQNDPGRVPGEVVPEPAAVVLALMALPALWLLGRRRPWRPAQMPQS